MTPAEIEFVAGLLADYTGFDRRLARKTLREAMELRGISETWEAGIEDGPRYYNPRPFSSPLSCFDEEEGDVE